MNKTILAVGALLASANLASAQGFQFEAARIGGEYQYYSETGFDVSSWEASLDASATFGQSLGMQVGLGYMSEFASSDAGYPLQNITDVELHGFYDIGTFSRIGMLYAFDTYNDGDDLFALEVVNAIGGLRGEARIGFFASDVEPAMLTEVNLVYGLGDTITLRGNYQKLKYNDGNGFYRLWSLGAGLDIGQSASFYADYGWTRNDFGNGSVFDGNLLSAGFSFKFAGDDDQMMFTYSPFF